MKLQYVGAISPVFVPAHNEYLDIETGDVVEFTDTLGASLLESAIWEKAGTKAAAEALAAVEAGPQSYEDALAELRAQAELALVGEHGPEAEPAAAAPRKRAPKKAAAKKDQPAPPANDVSPDSE